MAHDLHPEYLSTKYAVANFPADRRIAVQHHHAHVVSCAAEHGLNDPFIGVAYDGLGMGDDGTLWGGEILAADLTGYRRLARFGRAPLPGGALAVKKPWRMALGYLLGAEAVGEHERAAAGGVGGGEPADPELVAAFTARLDPREVAVLRTQVTRRLNAPIASSAGRLFDAAASLLGLRDVAEYEAQAAIDLEIVAGDRRADPLPARVARVDGILVYDPRPTLGALLEGAAAGRPPGVLAAAFHETIAEVTRELVAAAASRDRPAVGLPLGWGLPEPSPRLDAPAPARRGRLRGLHQPPGSGQRRRDQLWSGGHCRREDGSRRDHGRGRPNPSRLKEERAMCLGIPGKVIEIRDDAGLPMGKVDFGGVRKEACLAYIPEIQLGDYVIVHVGFAISRVDEEEALKTLEILATMGDLVSQELATMGPGMDQPAVVSDDGTPATGAFGGVPA